ncbi:hypothetical protein [Massilia sp. DWR3-1-1]|uniref:hypothetical protein n=1 Tax=Massilia sp. DWR3-1-1 TaxID=2804559 RepID=UPI003CECE7E4
MSSLHSSQASHSHGIHSTATAPLADAHRNAYNAAFHELGLRFHWDSAQFQGGQCADGDRECLRRYLQTEQAHLLKAYDADFLVDAIEAAKQRCYAAMNEAGCRPAAFINWAEIQQHHAGV